MALLGRVRYQSGGQERGGYPQTGKVVVGRVKGPVRSYQNLDSRGKILWGFLWRTLNAKERILLLVSKAVL